MSGFEESWRDTWVNVNGEYVKGPEATTSVLDWSFVYGDGIFEGVSVTDGKILKLNRHVDRLYRSAKRVGIDIPLSKEAMGERWLDTAKKNSMKNGYLRPLVSRGVGPLGIKNMDALDGPNIYVIPQTHRTGGINTLDSAKARTVSVRAPSPLSRDPRVKANHYLPNILAIDELKGTNATVPILLDHDGYITEAAAGNIFVVTNGTIRTPTEHQILAGTTRAALIELLEPQEQWDIEITDLLPYDLFTANECFMSGSIAGITAITHLNSRPIGTGNVGPAARELNQILADHLLETGTPIV